MCRSNALTELLRVANPSAAPACSEPTPRVERAGDAGEDPSMLLHARQTFLSRLPDGESLTAFVRAHWMLAVGVTCGHELLHVERHRATCPTCGATLNGFLPYRDLHAGR